VGRVDDVPATLAAAATIVVPLRVGGGTRLKILEALAAARPVVTTTIGAEGLPVEHGRHLLVADAPDEFARAVLAVLADAGLASRLGEDGRRLAREQFDWSHIAERVGHEIARIVHT
jgi:glycosyltransferase involved in cell wall biosynthesis